MRRDQRPAGRAQKPTGDQLGRAFSPPGPRLYGQPVPDSTPQPVPETTPPSAASVFTRPPDSPPGLIAIGPVKSLTHTRMRRFRVRRVFLHHHWSRPSRPPARPPTRHGSRDGVHPATAPHTPHHNHAAARVSPPNLLWDPIAAVVRSLMRFRCAQSYDHRIGSTQFLRWSALIVVGTG